MSTNVLVATSQVKFLTGITTTDNDLLIESLVPIVLEDITRYTHNYFINSTMYFYSDRISFSTSTLYCSDTELDLTDYFISGNICHVSRSMQNNGYLSISSALGTSYLTFNETVNAETTSTGKWILLYRVEYPKDLQFIASKMIKHILLTQSGDNIQSESLGNHSITYADVGNNSYPITIANSLNKYRKAVFI